jgi:hypothetical protein
VKKKMAWARVVDGLKMSLHLSLLFLLVIPSVASEPAFSRSSFVPSGKRTGKNRNSIVCAHITFAVAQAKKREKAGSLAALGMTSQKGNSKNVLKANVSRQTDDLCPGCGSMQMLVSGCRVGAW